MRYKDKQGKDLLRKKWAYRPTKWDEQHWVRALPSDHQDTRPRLLRSAQPGSLSATTQPDGMYVQLVRGKALTADVLAMEICGTLQNAHDKRSRFLASTSSLLLELPGGWLRGREKIQKAKKPRWSTFNKVFVAEPAEETLHIPVARLRVFLFVPDEDLEAFAEKLPLEPHEYLLPHTALRDAYSDGVTQMRQHAFAPRVWSR